MKFEDIVRESHRAVLMLDDSVELEDAVSIADVLTKVLHKGSECQPYVLSLCYRKIELDDLLALVEFVKKSPDLIFLELSNCEIDFSADKNIERAFIELISSIKSHPGLRAVDFSDANLSSEVLNALANMIGENKTLLQLSLAGNKDEHTSNVWLNFGKLILASLQRNETLLAFSVLSTPLEQGNNREVRDVRKLFEDKLESNRRVFLNRAEANPQYLAQFIIPNSINPFLESQEFEDEQVDEVTLGVLPLKYIKKEQNKHLLPLPMVSMQSQYEGTTKVQAAVDIRQEVSKKQEKTAFLV